MENQEEQQFPQNPKQDDIPLIFADGHQGAIYANGVIRLRLIRTEFSEQESIHKSVAQLAFSLETLQNFHQELGTLIENLKRDGIIHPSTSETPENQNNQ